MRKLLSAALGLLLLATPALAQTIEMRSQYPQSADPITASATGTTAATVATLPGRASQTTFICGLSVRSTATAAVTGNVQVTGTIVGAMNFTHWTGPVATAIGITEEVFTPCIPASGAATNIVVISPAAGTAGVISVTAWGYRLPGPFQ